MSRQKQPHVWVIEMDCGTMRRPRFEPCSDAQVTKQDAEREMNYYWKHNNPTDSFRVKKYVRAK